MNNELDQFEQELKSLHPRGLSGRAMARIRHELEPASRWLWWLALGAAAGITLALMLFSSRAPKPVIAKKTESPPALVLSRQYDGVVMLDQEGPYRRMRYQVARANGPRAEVVVLQKASLD